MYSTFAHLINYVLIESILLRMIYSNFLSNRIAKGEIQFWNSFLEEFIHID